MSTQIFRGHSCVVLAAFLLAGCDARPPDAPAVEHGGDNKVNCAVSGATTLAPLCTAERGPGGFLTIRHPDGGFRRLRIYGDHVSTADGAEAARIEIVDGQSVVTVGADRYILNGFGVPAQ